MQRVTDNVKARYQRKGLANPSSTWPPFHAQSFTNLALVHQKITQLQAKVDTTKIARVRTRGDIHKIPELTSSIKLDNIHQIFTPISSHDQTQCPMSILIEGHPGIGKTTLAKEMCLQWANNQLLTSDKLLLSLMLRDPNVQKITSTEQLVKYTQSTDQVQCVLSYLQDNNGVGVTLIIDGFDELSSELCQTSFFRKVIEGDVLYNARIVVTSRPSASACLHQYVHRRIEVLGFEKSSKEQYMNNALTDKPDDLRKLKVHFQKYPNIDALCYIPLNMAIIVYLCLLGSLPPTATIMYESFILHTVCRHLKRVGNTPNDTSVTQIEKLPQPVCEVLQQLQKVAFDGLVKDKIVFTIEELPLSCKDDPTCYGLLQSTECYSTEEIGTPTQSFNFLHLGIQEYFAAKYVTRLPENEVYTLLKQSFVVTEFNLPWDINPDSKSVRLSNMWILYCGITSGQCKTLRHYLTTYGKPYPPRKPLMTSSLLSGHTRSHDPMSHPITMYTPTMTHLHSSHDQMVTPPAAAEQHFNSHVLSSGHTTNDWSSDQRISNTGTISQDILKDPLKVLYLFQCFQEAQDNVLCEVLSKSFDNDVINIRGDRLLPHQVVSLGFFLSRSHRNWKEVNLFQCHIRDHGMSILHQYLCEDKTNKHKITKINLDENDLTGASSHLIADIISHLQPHTLVLDNNKITNVRDISTAVITTSTVKVLNMSDNDLTEQEAVAISDMMMCLEELKISNNRLGDHGAELLSEGITNTKTLRVLQISDKNIGPSGTTSIANALSNNTSLEELYMHDDNFIGQDAAEALGSAIINNKTLKILSLHGTVDKELAMIIIRSLYNNNTITELWLVITLCKDDVTMVTNEAEMVNFIRKSHNEHIGFVLSFTDPQEGYYAHYTTTGKLSWRR